MHLLEREPQLRRLEHLLGRARDGYGGLVVLAGEAGAGKTSLVRQFLLGAGDVRVLTSFCEDLVVPEPLGPLYDLAREAKDGDDFSLMMIERTGKYIGTGVASIINLLNIERIVLGGGVMQAGDLILNPIIQEAKRRAFLPCFEATQIVVAALGEDAATIGAAMLARDAETN